MTAAAPDPSSAADDRQMLLGWLRYLREQVVAALDGLSEEQARWAPAPTANSLAGLVHHLMCVERWWFTKVFAGEPVVLPWSKEDPDADFRVPAGLAVSDVVDLYRQEAARSDEIVVGAESLDQRAAYQRIDTTLRWILTHMVEETARHAGHADITRELIDGRTGSRR